MFKLISRTASLNLNLNKFRNNHLKLRTLTKISDEIENSELSSKEESKKIKVAGSNYFQAIVKSSTSGSVTSTNTTFDNLDIETDKIKYDVVEKPIFDNLNDEMNQNDSHLFARKFLKKAKKQRIMSSLNKGNSNNSSELNNQIFPDVEVVSSSRDLTKEAYDSLDNKKTDYGSNKRKSSRTSGEKLQIRRVKDDYHSKMENKQMYREFKSKLNPTRTDMEKRIDFYESSLEDKSKKYAEYKPIKYEPPNDDTDIVVKKEYNLNQFGRNLTNQNDETKSLKVIEETKELEVNDDEKEENLTEEERLNREIERLRPSKRTVAYNLAYFVNSNPLLQKLVEMGVQIRNWDNDRKLCEFILRLDMEKLQTHLIFLHDLGLSLEDQRFILNKNPLFLKENIIDLNNRIGYLKSKKFDDNSIRRMIGKAPKWLSLSVNDVDTRLGWYQRDFGLTANELRLVVTEKPKLVTLPLKIPSDVRFCLKEILCYSNETIKQFMVTYPKLFTKDFKIIEANFIFLTQVMKLTHDQVAMYPPILQCPLILIKSRYTYLKHLNRLQFDPTLPNFVSLKSLCEPFDSKFCKNTAKTSLEEYKKFLKSI